MSDLYRERAKNLGCFSSGLAGITDAIRLRMTRKSLVVVTALCSLLIAQAASAQPRWGRERQPNQGACFYEDINFSGEYFCVRQGDRLTSMPSGMGDKISSVRVLGNAEVTIFRDSNLRGRSARLINDAGDLRGQGWNDQISSVDVTVGRDYSTYGNNGYGNNGYGNNGYQQGYANGNNQRARVLGITNVERRNNGALRVTGVASSGRAYGYGNQGYNGGYNGQRGYNANQSADLRFTCKVNTRGQVSDVNISRNQTAYRGY